MRGVHLLTALALLCAGGFACTYLVALHTSWGLAHDRILYEQVSGSPSPQVLAAGRRALRTIDVSSVAAAALLVVFFAAMRGRFVRALAAVGVIGCSVATAELLKHGLPQPTGRPPTFPSGHTSIAVSIGLGLVLAVPPLLRATAALVGAAYGAGIGLSVVVLGWHYPSDVIGSFLVCGFWVCVFGLLLQTSPRSRLSPASALIALAAMSFSLLVAVVVAERHRAAVESLRTGRAVVGTAALLAFVSLALFSAVTPLVEEMERP